MVARLLVTRAATAVDNVGLHVDTTAYCFLFYTVINLNKMHAKMKTNSQMHTNQQDDVKNEFYNSTER